MSNASVRVVDAMTGGVDSSVAAALLKQDKPPEPQEDQKEEFTARLTVSEREVLQGKDFAQMTAEEIARIATVFF